MFFTKFRTITIFLFDIYFFNAILRLTKTLRGIIMTAIQKIVKVVLKTRKWMLSLNYIPAGT